jgi:hypothetical protein
MACMASESGLNSFSTSVPNILYQSRILNAHQLLYVSYKFDELEEVPSAETYNVFKMVDLEDYYVVPPILSVLGDATDPMLVAGGFSAVAGIGRDRGVMAGRPTFELFKTLRGRQDTSPNFNAPGSAGMEGILAFFYGWKGIRLAADLTSRQKTNVFVDFQPMKEYKEVSGKMKFTIESQSGPKEWKVGKDKAGMDIDVDNQSIYLASDYTMKVYGVPDKMLDEVLPAGVTDTIQSEGFVFPYFDGLLAPDRDQTYNIFSRLFARSLAEDYTSSAAVLNEIRRGLRNLAITRQGQQLQHAYFVLQLALDAEATFLPVIHRGQYLGALVLGENIRLFHKGKLVVPLSADQIMAELRTFNVHDTSIILLAQLLTLSPFKSEPGRFERLTSLDLASARCVYNEVAKREISKSEKAEVRKLVDKLSFQEEYWVLNEENLRHLLQSLVNGRVAPDVPCYLRDGAVLCDDDFVAALSAFGPRAPTFRLGDKSISVPRLGAVDSNLTEDKDKRTAIPLIPVYLAPLLSAVQQMRAVYNNSTLNYFGAKKGVAGRFDDPKKRMYAITGLAKSELYTMLKEFCDRGRTEAQLVKDSQVAGRKRKMAQVEETEAGPSTKRIDTSGLL